MAFSKQMAMMGGKRPPMKGSKPKKESEPSEPKDKSEAPKDSDGGDDMSLKSHGDGSYETSDGEQHEHLGKALMHMAHHHEPNGKHMHMHHDGLGVRSSSVDEQGQHDTQEHDDAAGAAGHVQSFMGDDIGDPQMEPQHAEDALGY